MSQHYSAAKIVSVEVHGDLDARQISLVFRQSDNSTLTIPLGKTGLFDVRDVIGDFLRDHPEVSGWKSDQRPN